MSKETKKNAPKVHQGADNTAPYPVSRLAPAFELVDLAQAISAADASLASHATGKLKVIAEQIQQLQDAARQILEETRRSQELHRAACNFRRQPGHVYHLYRKPDGSTYFSMLTPADWSGKPPHEFVGAFRLESDMSWTPMDESREADNTDAAVRQLLDRLDHRDG